MKQKTKEITIPFQKERVSPTYGRVVYEYVGTYYIYGLDAGIGWRKVHNRFAAVLLTFNGENGNDVALKGDFDPFVHIYTPTTEANEGWKDDPTSEPYRTKYEKYKYKELPIALPRERVFREQGKLNAHTGGPAQAEDAYVSEDNQTVTVILKNPRLKDEEV